MAESIYVRPNLLVFRGVLGGNRNGFDVTMKTKRVRGHGNKCFIPDREGTLDIFVVSRTAHLI